MLLAGWFSTFNWGHKRHPSQYKRINQEVSPSAVVPGQKEQRKDGGQGSGGAVGPQRPLSLTCSLGLVRSGPLRAELQLRTWAAAAPQRVSTPPHPAVDGQPKPWGPTQQSGEWTTGSAQFPLWPASSQASTGSVGSEGLHGAWARSRVSLSEGESHWVSQPASLSWGLHFSAKSHGQLGWERRQSNQIPLQCRPVPSSSHCLHTPSRS